jgi:HK97 family phage prohead protease
VRFERLEFKGAVTVDDTGTITGLAWPFGSPDRVGDVITKGAFGSIRLPVPMLFGHDPNDPVGTWNEAVETEAGLEVKGRLLVGELARADEVRALVRSGAVGGLSIGFSTKAATPRQGARGRTITALDLVEISLVTVPSHPGARVRSAKSGAAAIQLAEAINRAALALRK